MPSTRALIHAPWSASKVATALRCPRLFHFKYIEKLKEPEVMAEARIGKSIHKALELVLQGTPIAEATDKLRAELPNETEQMRFDALGSGIAPFSTRISQFKRRRRVARQLVEYSLAVREDLTTTQFYAGDAYYRGVLDLGYIFEDDAIALVDQRALQAWHDLRELAHQLADVVAIFQGLHLLLRDLCTGKQRTDERADELHAVPGAERRPGALQGGADVAIHQLQPGSDARGVVVSDALEFLVHAGKTPEKQRRASVDDAPRPSAVVAFVPLSTMAARQREPP